MKYHSPILTICLTISTGCLVAGYVIAGYWLILPVLCVMPLFWIYTKSRSVFWSASSLLLIYIVLAAIGIIAGIPMMLMIIGCTTALASWDLTQLKQSILENARLKTGTSFEKYHLRSLALSLSAGIVLSFASVYINLQLPFGVIVFLTLLAISGLTYSVQFMKKRHT